MNELNQLLEGALEQPEVALPSYEEQQAIVKRLKSLEAAGELTPEILAEYFEKYNDVKETSAQDIEALHQSMA